MNARRYQGDWPSDPRSDSRPIGAFAFAEAEHADFPLLADPVTTTANPYGVLGGGPVAKRWTFYIGKDSKILAIDKMVKPATSAEDMAAKLGELNVAKK